MSYVRSLCLCLQGHSQLSQVTCRNKSSLSCTLLTCLSFNKYRQTFIFWMHYSNQWLYPTPFYIFPPLTNSLSISLKTACSKVLKSVKFIFEWSYLSLLPFPYSWCPRKLFSALRTASRKDSKFSLIFRHDCIFIEDIWVLSYTRNLCMVPQ